MSHKGPFLRAWACHRYLSLQPLLWANLSLLYPRARSHIAVVVNHLVYTIRHQLWILCKSGNGHFGMIDLRSTLYKELAENCCNWCASSLTTTFHQRKRLHDASVANSATGRQMSLSCSLLLTSTPHARQHDNTTCSTKAYSCVDSEWEMYGEKMY